MSATDMVSYRALIGGCHFTNVRNIITFEGEPILSVEVDDRTSKSSVNVDLRNDTGAIFARINKGVIDLADTIDYQIHKEGYRSSIINVKNGQIVFDSIEHSPHIKVDFVLNATIYLPNRIPIFLHPNRTRIGASNILKPHFMSLRFATDPGKKGAALRIELDSTEIVPNRFLVPSAPMVGNGSLVQRLLEAAPAIPSELTTLFLAGESPEAPLFQTFGPCYLLDVAIVDFETAFAIKMAAKPQAVAKGQDGAKRNVQDG